MIANHIAAGKDYVAKSKLRKAVEIASIKEFIENLSLNREYYRLVKNNWN